eukprot:SAG11_NODE_2267_length_3601_cov_2.234723_1_plen_57_part_00
MYNTSVFFDTIKYRHDGCFTTAKILLDQLKSFVYVRTADYAAISKMKKPEALQEAI